MSVREEFDRWASEGRDKGMEERHWHTAKHALARMPVEPGDTVLDLGCGSGYAGRALRETADAGRVYGLDAAPEMASNARSYTDDSQVTYLVSDFEHLPFADDSVDHCFSMEAFYYASDPHVALSELARVLRPGGTFYCAVNFYEENVHSHHWPEMVGVEMTRWSEREYRQAFRDAGLHVAGQDRIPDREITIPPADEFPTENWASRADMIERYRTYGTLLTVGVAP
ncbi:class I SAM-dependent methyltransferase [Halorientalis pallida]|uniref:Class I SAM-dependent methyltransferase n=1 Tax=Halorientalis pallida TaxID=2479928 RepID=A0A498L6H6_9EURY|nr:class I SAM-dependent methyltransferase [Halorientalis pallida]RXK50305.1 class I SAM-dependent methyltransferase [Halorientalis pallida]